MATFKSSNDRSRYMQVVHFSEMKNTPPILFHGTECTNIESILDKGILAGTEKTCNLFSVKDSMGNSHIDDCVGNVSLAVDKSDAIFFIVANRTSREEFMKPQCILKVNVARLNTDKLFFRDLMGRSFGEAKYLDSVPPEAIEGYFERSFHTKEVKGKSKLVATERFIGNPKAVMKA